MATEMAIVAVANKTMPSGKNPPPLVEKLHDFDNKGEDQRRESHVQDTIWM